MQSVILINPIAVPVGEEEEFLKGWRIAAEHMRRALGFRPLRLHRSVNPEAQFRFVNIAEWESPEQWQAAVHTQPSEMIRPMLQWTAYPALYEVVIA